MELIGDSNRWLTSGALCSAGVVNEWCADRPWGADFRAVP